MSMYLEFEPHSWYKGAAIRKEHRVRIPGYYPARTFWSAYIDNGNTYQVDEVNGRTLTELKNNIDAYHAAETARIEATYAQLETCDRCGKRDPSMQSRVYGAFEPRLCSDCTNDGPGFKCASCGMLRADDFACDDDRSICKWCCGAAEQDGDDEDICLHNKDKE